MTSDVKRILIADDEPTLRLLVRATIESGDCEIVEAANGDEAWDLIQTRHPALALLDVQMPGRTGLELTRAIKSDPALAAIRVILLTSQTLETDIERGLAAGADWYLTKPFSPLELLTVVEQALAAT